MVLLRSSKVQAVTAWVSLCKYYRNRLLFPASTCQIPRSVCNFPLVLWVYSSWSRCILCINQSNTLGFCFFFRVIVWCSRQERIYKPFKVSRDVQVFLFSLNWVHKFWSPSHKQDLQWWLSKWLLCWYFKELVILTAIAYCYFSHGEDYWKDNFKSELCYIVTISMIDHQIQKSCPTVMNPNVAQRYNM